MRRGPKPAKSKEAKLPVARKSPKSNDAKVRDLEKRLAEALEQQTATAEILRAISSSPTDIKPVLDAVARSAMRLCESYDAMIMLREGEELHFPVHHGPIRATVQLARRAISRGWVGGRAVLDRQPVHVHDLATAGAEFPVGQADAVRAGYRTTLSVPLLREGEAIGVIHLRRREVRPFTDNQIALLQTFADQAVIAIENVRLFNETKEALEQQTATSEILRVVSSSRTDLQPVFDAILQSATRLCGARFSALYRYDGDLVHLAAHYNLTPEVLALLRQAYPTRPAREIASGRAILSAAVVHIPNALADPEYRHDFAIAGGWGGLLAVPMIREGRAVGTINIYRTEAKPFPEGQIELLKTFADQAAIAIENARLLTELQARTAQLTRSVQELQALGEVSQALSSTLDLDAVLNAIVTRVSQLAGTDACSVYEYDEATEAFHLRATDNLDEDVVALARQTPIRKGEGIQGRMAVTRQPVQVPDIAEEDAYRGPLRDILLRTGTRAVLAIPMLRESELIGGFTVNKRTPGEFSPEVIELLTTFATQSALAIQNARLFREIEEKSRQLEVASQHKSEFLANMSHELRTPLNAIIGFSEVLSERMFGDLNEKQEEYLKDIYASGTHLLSLINDILDLSKIEAGRMELELTNFHLPTALDSALTLVRERAGRRGIALQMNVDSRLGQIQADERKVRQVVLNLLSNAIKFTPEGGRIDVAATPKDGLVEVSVSDTGVGIAPEDQEAVFEEFRQVGTADKKVEGTGLGLTLCRKFVELHGGKIWVKSELGVGSTFTFSVPLRS
jgi:two-component system, NtrC family, sensor kinase